MTIDLNQIINADCFDELKKLPNASIDACITDPPYNYEFIGHKWDSKEIDRRIDRIKDSKTLVKYIPYGSGLAGGVRNKRWYEKVRNNILDYQEWVSDWGTEVFRVLKEGSFILVFNSTRTVAHVQIALENAGFYARDILVWRKRSGIPKGYNAEKQLQKKGVEDYQKWQGWHSCLRNEWEAVCVLQKPLINNYTETLLKNDIGLLKAQGDEGGFRSNILEGLTSHKREKFNVHCTVKPLELISHLVELVVPPDKNKIVLDPFMGSGTTAVAALRKGVSFIGYEINPEYCDIAAQRLKSEKEANPLLNFD
ncbi:MAG: site-specific DNA-methyltransferase [Desulfovibrio sp.]